MVHLNEYNGGRRNGAARAAMKARAGDVLEDFSALRKDMKKLARAANKAARVEVQHAGSRLGDVSDTLRQRAQEHVESVSEHVRDRPGAAIGLSLGAGLLLGMLISPRR